MRRGELAEKAFCRCLLPLWELRRGRGQGQWVARWVNKQKKMGRQGRQTQLLLGGAGQS